MDPPEDQTSDTPTGQVYEGQPFGNVFDESKLDDDMWTSGGGLWDTDTLILPKGASAPAVNAHETSYISTEPVANAETPFSSVTGQDTFPTNSGFTMEGLDQPHGVFDFGPNACVLYNFNRSAGMEANPGMWTHGTLNRTDDLRGVINMPPEGIIGGPPFGPGGSTFIGSGYGNSGYEYYGHQRTEPGLEPLGTRTANSATSDHQPRTRGADTRRALACATCSRAKTRCDKGLPSCSRCISKNIQCEPRTTARGTFHRSSWSPY